MTTYKIFLTKKYQIEASIYERPDARYLLTIDLDLADYVSSLQTAVDGTLCQLNDAAFPSDTNNLN